ncbi:hypothetical protein J4Q44_G00285760, partial [Coregonus suidteri]
SLDYPHLLLISFGRPGPDHHPFISSDLTSIPCRIVSHKHHSPGTFTQPLPCHQFICHFTTTYSSPPPAPSPGLFCIFFYL